MEDGHAAPKRAGHSYETPRRWWVSSLLGEVRVYNFGFELYFGSGRRFLVFQLGSDRCGSRVHWVTS